MIKYQNKCPCGCDEPNIRLFRGWVSYSNAQGWKTFNYNEMKDYESTWKMHWH